MLAGQTGGDLSGKAGRVDPAPVLRLNGSEKSEG